jgi:exodeoxyribonuclease V beta subunit
VGSAELDAALRFFEAEGERHQSTPEDPGGAGFGVAVHRVLELVPLDVVRQARTAAELSAAPEVVALALESAQLSGLDERALPLLYRLVLGGLKTVIGALGPRVTLADAARRATEVPFVHVLPEPDHPPPGAAIPKDARLAPRRGYLRGVLDLVVEHEGKLWVIDWKTDRLSAYDPASVAAHVAESYAIQLRLYSLALRRILGAERDARIEERFGGVLFVFLRGRLALLDRAGEGTLLDPLDAEAGLFVSRPSHRELDEWDAELRASDAPFGYPLGAPPLVPGRLRRGALLGSREQGEVP